ncbi:MAG TPA: hypothetical protein VK188_06835 [Holophaga sp.]|nr:hypothetical protein [Holophaga sp.]
MPSPTGSRFLPAWAPALLLLLWACGGGGGGARLQPPGQFTVTSNPATDFDTLFFSWQPVSGQVDGYNLQASLDGEIFQSLNSTLIPRDSVGATLNLYASVPELTTLVFRVDSVLGSTTSDWAKATYQRGIRPPESLFALQVAAYSRIHLAWSSRSLVADRLTLKRTARSASGGPPVSTTLAMLAPSATS